MRGGEDALNRSTQQSAINIQPKQKAPFQSPESPTSRVIADIGDAKNLTADQR
jgi:hypothetical protein